MSVGKAHTARSVVVGKHTHLAPDGWVFVVNDPDVVKHPERLFALLHQEKRVVIVADVESKTFRIDDYRLKHRIDGHYLPEDEVARFRIGRTPFTDLGPIGRALIFAFSNAD